MHIGYIFIVPSCLTRGGRWLAVVLHIMHIGYIFIVPSCLTRGGRWLAVVLHIMHIGYIFIVPSCLTRGGRHSMLVLSPSYSRWVAIFIIWTHHRQITFVMRITYPAHYESKGRCRNFLFPEFFWMKDNCLILIYAFICTWSNTQRKESSRNDFQPWLDAAPVWIISEEKLSSKCYYHDRTSFFLSAVVAVLYALVSCYIQFALTYFSAVYCIVFMIILGSSFNVSTLPFIFKVSCHFYHMNTSQADYFRYEDHIPSSLRVKRAM